MTIRKGIRLSVILVALDQFIKLIIYHFAMEKKRNLIGDFIDFSPVFNKNISWLSAKTGLNIGLIPHIVFTIAVIIVFILLGIKYYDTYADKKYMILAYFITLAGIICSAIDRILWGTSLDYIGIKGFCVFDLKDLLVDAMYVLTIGIILNERAHQK